MRKFSFLKKKQKKTDEEIMEEVREIKKKAEQKELDEWIRKDEENERIIQEEVERVIEGLTTLSARCLEATKNGRNSVRVMKLERRHLSGSKYSFKKLSYHYSHSWLDPYSKYIDNPDILNLISILESKGFRVFIEMQKRYSKNTNIDELKDSPIEWLNPNAYLSIKIVS
ncbi:MAG: hypothetical protein KAQ64_01695 [Candidatus Pacebacteria bacterium]|nr:hypothetical protein [Candidatus Paceibacterota bacterium]